MSDEVKKAPSLDAARREKWKREALHGIELRTKRFGEFLRAVRELIAALPKCDEYIGHTQCRATATRVRGVWTNEGNDYVGQEHLCEAHAPLGTPALNYAPALRKLQAMLNPEETEKP